MTDRSFRSAPGRTRRRRPGPWAATALAATLSIPVLAPAQASAQDAAKEAAAFFRQNCTSCHTIGGGRLVGPDLKNVTERQDRAWLVHFINDPKTVLASGDAIAAKLRQEANGAVMTPIPGMTPQRANDLLDMIEAESKLEKSQFAGLHITDEPFAPADVLRGRRIFLGAAALTGGGPACASCHTVAGLGGLGGGRLAPDLTKVYERLGGRKGLASWLQAPATATMRPLFATRPLANEEVLSLTAFLEDEARGGPVAAAAGARATTGTRTATGGPRLTFLLLGLSGAALALVAADAVWRKRLRGVRRALLRGVR